MSSIDKMAEKFESVAELKEYSNAQYRTIIAQAKKISELEEKNKELEKLLVNGGSSLIENPNQSSILSQIQGLSDEEAIAVMEIAKLKQISLERDLDVSECKKYEVYTKTLVNIRASKKASDIMDNLGDIDESKLLSALIDEK